MIKGNLLKLRSNPMPPLNKLKSGTFTLEFKRELSQNAGGRGREINLRIQEQK